MTNSDALVTGGCQCGAVRYALASPPTGGSICHCRMCQKATGGLFGAFIGVPHADLRWTRGTPSAFRSSEAIDREFCRDCGTPLTFRQLDKDRVSVTIGSLDEPARADISHQWGVESTTPAFASLSSLPGTTTEASMPPERLARRASRQHPDRNEQ
jgi:hypothetical protein